MEVGRVFNTESMDLNALYQQDIDLGVGWQMLEPLKNLKEVGFEGKATFDAANFIVDGETGEYLPIAPMNGIQQKPIENDTETGQVEFNFDDFLDSDISEPQQDKELWDDLNTLSEAYLALDSGEFAQEKMSETGSPMEENMKFQQMNQFSSDVFGGQVAIQIPEQQTQKEQQIFTIQSPYHNFPTPPYIDQGEAPQNFSHPSSITFPPNNDESFGPAKLEEVELADLLMTQQNDLLVQLDNVSQLNMGNAPPTIVAEKVTSPGTWFFSEDEPTNNFSQVLTDLDVMNNVPNQPAPYMNPPSAPYVPPPMAANQGRISVASESEDSEFADMGISHMDVEMHEVEPSYVLLPADQNKLSLEERDREARREKRIKQRESRDLKKARELNIQLTMDQIINSPVEEYNELLSSANLNPSQQALVRDIRRRGKNKVAAQNCRKRKIETISSMEMDIEGLNVKHQDLLTKQKELGETKRTIEAKYNQLYKQIFNSLRDESGRSYDKSRYSLQQVDGAIILVPGSYGNKPESKGSVAFFDLSKVKIEKEI